MNDIIEGSASYPNEVASHLPVISGPWPSLEAAEKAAASYTVAGVDVVIDYRNALGSRPTGYVIRDAGDLKEEHA